MLSYKMSNKVSSHRTAIKADERDQQRQVPLSVHIVGAVQ